MPPKVEIGRRQYRDHPPQRRPARMLRQKLKGRWNEHRQRVQRNQPRLIRRRPIMFLDGVVKAVQNPLKIRLNCLLILLIYGQPY